jgi:hypothetical protein
MATSGTATFNLDVPTIVEEAYERCGREVRTGYELRTARRSLNLLLMEWANRGINLWTVEQGSIAMVDGTATYNLPVDTVDLMDCVLRTGSGTTQQDLSMSRISSTTYATIPNKNSEGRPLQYWVDRQSGATEPSGVAYPTVTVWPVPDASSTYTFVYWRLRRMQDATQGAINMDVPWRFMPALVAGLAYHLAIKLPDMLEKIPLLKGMYDEAWQAAAEEDREKAPIKLVPRVNY